MPGSLRFGTFLAPSMFQVYQFVAQYVGQQLGYRAELVVGESFAQFAAGDLDVGFICGLPYVELTRRQPARIVPLVAPVIQGARYQGRPVYYSDVIVRRDSPFQTVADLRGRRWSYNDCDSHSGYNITRYELVRLGETGGYFGEVVAAGWHQRSIALVAAGEIDASAIDSHVLELALREQPDLAEQLRVIASWGPSTIQPLVASSRLPAALQDDLRSVLASMAGDATARRHLAEGLIDRFVPIADAAYDDIRAMLAAVEAAHFLTLK